MTTSRPAFFASHTPRGTFYHLYLSSRGDVSAIVTSSSPDGIAELSGPAQFSASSSDGPCVKLRDTITGRVVRLQIDEDDFLSVKSMFDQSLPVAERIPFADLNIDEEGDAEDEDEDREDDEDPRCGMCRGDGCPSCGYSGGAYD